MVINRIMMVFILIWSLGCNAVSDKPLKRALEMSVKNSKGQQYSLQNQGYLTLSYDRNYTNIGTEFLTTYITYNPNSGEAIHKITITHDTSTNKIDINVKALFGGVFKPDDLNYKLNVKEDIKTLQPWGKEGFYRKMSGSGVPYETLVQFATEDFNYVNLLEIMSEDNHGERYWYLLDQQIDPNKK